MHVKSLLIVLYFMLDLGACNMSTGQDPVTKAGSVIEQRSKETDKIDVWRIEKVRELTPALGSISFGGNGIGFIGGTDQRFWISYDGGNSWNEASISFGKTTKNETGWYDIVKSVITKSAHIHAIGHLEESGSIIFSLSHGLEAWKASSYPESALNDITSAADKVWVVGTIQSSAVVLKLSDDGKWQIIWKAKQGEYLEGVEFINSQLGWVVGQKGLILRTIDGGNILTRQSSPVRNNLTSISFADAENGFAVGDHGTILTTNNGGSSWSKSDSRTQVELTMVKAISSREACVIGRNGIVMRTVNAGRDWYQYPLGIDADVYALSVSGNDCWIAASNGAVFRLPGR